MRDWKRVKSATEWGFFFGILSWLLATGITNETPAAGVWGIILSRTVVGFIIGYIKWKSPWWMRGLIIGGALNLIFGLVVKIPLGDAVQSITFMWARGFWLMLITGIGFGLSTELALRYRDIRSRSDKRPPWWTIFT
ncbi:MAG: hypothetical protein ABIL68_17795 [bacterium]